MERPRTVGIWTTLAPFFMTTMIVLGCARSKEFIKPDIDFTKYKRIAVFPLSDYPGKPGSGIQVTDMVAVRLLNSNFDVLDRTETASVLEEQQLGLSGLVDEETAPTVGRILGVQALLTGSITEYKTLSIRNVNLSTAKLTLKLVDCETGQIVWAVSARGEQVGGDTEAMAAEKAIDDIVQKLAKHMQ